MSTIGEKIRKLRGEKHLKQRELADMIGTDNNTISRWERNKLGVGNVYIVRLAKALGTSADYLLDKDDENTLNDDIKYQKIDSGSNDFSLTEKLIDSNKMIVYETSNGRFFIPATSEGFDFIKGMSVGQTSGNLAVAR